MIVANGERPRRLMGDAREIERGIGASTREPKCRRVIAHGAAGRITSQASDEQFNYMVTDDLNTAYGSIDSVDGS